MANIAAIVQKAEQAASKGARVSASGTKGAAERVAQRASGITDDTAREVSSAVEKMPLSKQKQFAAALKSRGVMIGAGVLGTGAVGTAFITSMSDDVKTASPDDMRVFLQEADNQNQEAGDAAAKAYNEAVHVSDLDLDFSDKRSEDGFVSQVQVSGLGFDRERIETEQAILEQYRLVRSTLAFEQIVALQFLFGHAFPSDLAALEDIHRHARR